MLVYLEEVHLPGHILLATSVAKGDISRKTADKGELDLLVTQTRSPQMISQNGSLRSLLFHIPKIFQHPPWPATTISRTGAPLEIVAMVYGDFTGMMATMSGKTIKARSNLFVLQSRYQ